MTKQNQLLQILRPEYLLKSSLQGAFIAFILFSIFLISSFVFGDPPKIGFWVLLPVLTVSLAGGFGGILYHITNQLWHDGWKKTKIIRFCHGAWVFTNEVYGDYHYHEHGTANEMPYECILLL